jgi:predicted DNA-binding protein (MmcQ/YjbR family)
MDIEKYRNYCMSKKQVTEGFPFPSLPNVLVFKVAGKMFTATDVTTFASISVKCHPDDIEELRSKYQAFTMHTYFSNKHWGKVIMDHSISDKLLLEWIDVSYDLVVAGLSKKTRAELNL